MENIPNTAGARIKQWQLWNNKLDQYRLWQNAVFYRAWLKNWRILENYAQTVFYRYIWVIGRIIKYKLAGIQPCSTPSPPTPIHKTRNKKLKIPLKLASRQRSPLATGKVLRTWHRQRFPEVLYHILDFKRSSRTLDTKGVGLGDTECLQQREGRGNTFFLSHYLKWNSTLLFSYATTQRFIGNPWLLPYKMNF